MPAKAAKKVPSGAPAPNPGFATASKGGLKVAAYRGDGSILLAFNLDKKPTAGFAGFAVRCTPPNGKAFWLKNRLNFSDAVTAQTTPAQRQAIATPSNEAPYQKFRWADFSSWQEPGAYTYEVSAMYRKNKALTAAATVPVTLQLGPFQSGKLQAGFTRGLLSSQAYVDQFKNAPIRPAVKSIDYSTLPYEAQYEWLGFHARRMVFDFLKECFDDPKGELDVFAYDLDEPDIIGQLKSFGGRMRAVLDNAPLHTKPGAMEILAKTALLASAGQANMRLGHFKRFAHDKVFIHKQDGKAIRVLTGSANFSVRGLYVQANNVLVFDDPDTAALYEEAFQQSFEGMADFSSSEIADGWHDMPPRPDLPTYALAFSPHKTAEVSLGRVAEAVKGATSSVLFAIMELGGGGDVLQEIKGLAANPKIFSYGVTQSLAGASLYKPGCANGILTPFAYLSQHVPPPFSQEISGGPGQVIHDKFIVVDFNTPNAKVYTGSSNLAAGGEESNGDNLIELKDGPVASIFASQAIGLVDHFHFRAVQQSATTDQPMCLSGTDDWWQEYFTAGKLKFRDRAVFCP